MMLSSPACLANPAHTIFPGGATLTFSLPLTSDEKKNFGSGWKMATYENTKDGKFNLFPMEALTSSGGVLFADAYPPEVSPSGKYVIIDVLRVGTVNLGEPGKPEVQSRQYCPVLETRTGCIVSNQSGELCGGEWQKKHDRWIVRGLTEDASTPMLQYQFEDANTLWKKYSTAKNKPFHISIREAVSANFGVYNLMACDRPSANNVAAYRNIAMELKKAGDNTSSEYITNKFHGMTTHGGHIEPRKILTQRALLFDKPSSEYQTKMYLIKGDDVGILEEMGEEWLKIEYKEKNGRSIQKWIRSKSIN